MQQSHRGLDFSGYVMGCWFWLFPITTTDYSQCRGAGDVPPDLPHFSNLQIFCPIMANLPSHANASLSPSYSRQIAFKAETLSPICHRDRLYWFIRLKPSRDTEYRVSYLRDVGLIVNSLIFPLSFHVEMIFFSPSWYKIAREGSFGIWDDLY